MSTSSTSILILGESKVGKTHYGAQILKRLMKGDGQLRMDGAASNLEPFQAAMDCLDEGVAAGHTSSTTYVDSVWPITDAFGAKAELFWPDYGGEQVLAIAKHRTVPAAWRDRIRTTPAWLLFVRLQLTRTPDDVLNRPLNALTSTADNHEVNLSDQARLIELLQILLYVRGSMSNQLLQNPRLCVVLSCWDELNTLEKPADILLQRLPMFASFIASNWADPIILGLSALGQSLSAEVKDIHYAQTGSDQFGYVVLPDGQQSTDLTLPIQSLLSAKS